MNDTQLDNQLKAARQEQRQFNQSTVKRSRQIEDVVKEAVNQKYHSPSKKACTVYMKFKTAGYSDVAADSMCKQAHRYGINPNLSPGDILNAVKSKTAQLSNNKPSTEPGNTGVPDKQFSESSYGSDVPSCIASLTSLGVDESRAREECETQYAGKGYRGGQNVKGPSGLTVKKSAGSRAIQVHNASIDNSIPSWVYAATGGNPPNLSNASSNIKSARTEDQGWYTTYALSHTHPDDVNGSFSNPELDKLVQKRGNELATIAAIREDRKLKNASKKADPYGEKPYWSYVIGL